ncbi:Sugar transporter STL1-like protein 5 [Colletotrichum chlorophyti]|uniref:Sugar transporter STL1-like protein 5 n=1 Tax=Colletotrichum chlorophyti TaxID=708187 RepID=A0A1Q8S3V1_9PEZI|nr:Sugar transporter STL1-like protein 5 [Colletotrichum chlorophyti]
MGSKKYFGLTGNALNNLRVALIIAPSFILYGYNIGVVGGLLTEADWVKTFPEIDTVSSVGDEKSRKSTLQGFIVATFTIGATIGSLSCSWTGDIFGRRNIIFFSAILTLVGEVLMAASFGLPQFVVGRVITGLGIGQLSSIVPVWQSETSAAANRGRQVVVSGLFMCVGYMLESWIDLGFYQFHSGPITWRPPLAVAVFFSLVLMASIYFFPESPRWLVMKGRSEQARAVISVLKSLPPDFLEVQAELSGIEYSLEETKGSQASLKDMLKMGEDKLLYRFTLCMALQFFQQMAGSNLVSVYAPILFQQGLGLSSQNSRILSGGTLTWKFLASFIAFFTIDRFGRRAAFIVSGTGMSLCMIALAIATSFGTDNYPAQIAAAFFIFLYNTWIPIGLMGANYLYCTEVAPLRLRMAMSSISTANHWLFNFLVIMVTPVALNTIGWRYYIVYAVIAAAMPVAVYFFFPETTGRNLEEIDLLFRESPSVLATVRYAKTRPIAMPQEFNSEKDEKAAHVEGA